MPQVPLLNMPEYAWMYLRKHDSEYALVPTYAKILHMAKFWIWQGSEYARVIQGSKDDTIWLNMSEWDVYMTEHVWIYNNRQSFEYVSYNTQSDVTLQVNKYL